MQITGPAQPPGFSPALLIVHVNDTVVFVNQSSPPTPFSVTSNDSSFSSPTIAPGNQWTATFNAIGTHQYHETSNPQRMVGEVIVVTNAVALLPTPIPEAEATVLAAIEAGHSPPDTIILPTPTMSTAARSNSVSTSSSPLPWILTIVAILALIGFGIWFFRRMRRRAREREEAEDNLPDEATPTRPAPHQTEPPPQPVVEQPAPAKKTRKLVIAGFLRRRKKDDDDDMDMEIEDYGDE